MAELLRARLAKDGRHLGRGSLKSMYIARGPGFINHMIDPVLMRACGQELAERFRSMGVTKVLTVETSGVAPALMTGLELGCPVIYCRSGKCPITMENSLTAESASHTKGGSVSLFLSQAYLKPEDKVLIVDDFLASGTTIRALMNLISQANAQLVGIASLIEKPFEGGRELLSKMTDVPIVSLATIHSLQEGNETIFFAPSDDNAQSQ